jgi:small-conductance mechanosensitive channel
MNDTLSYNEIPGTNLLEKILYLNTLQSYLIGAAALLIGILLLKAIQKIIVSRMSRLSSPIIQYLLNIERYAYPLLFALFFIAVFNWYNVTDTVERFSGYVFKVVTIFLGIRLIVAAVRNALYSYLKRQDDTGTKEKQLRGIVLILSGVLWIVGLLFLFDNLGFNVTAILTGLGVGGIAIALAAQTILGDMFNYFVIFFDRPFEVGDFIIVDDKMGVVEYIGIKTTRIKSLSGEQIVFSNSNLTNARLHNYKRMSERRIVFKFGIAYYTGQDKLAQVPAMIRQVVENNEGTRFDRAHFAKFGEYSLDFEVVYYVLDADFNRYMDIQQKINLEIYRKFESAKIEFAFPSYLAKLWKNMGQVNGKAIVHES